MDVVATIKNKIVLNEYVAQHVRLKRSSKGYFNGCCPFHKDKTPSFYVNDSHYKCFGCGETGDIFSFYSKLHGTDFKTSVLHFTESLGIDNTGFNKNVEDIALNYVIAKTYSEYLRGSKALDYLHKRGLTDQTIKEYSLGYSPATIKAGVELSEYMQRVGVLDKSGRNRFADAVIIPIADRGDIVGFAARYLGDSRIKYLNTYNNGIYQKGNILYGYDKSKPYVSKSNAVIVLEGYFDQMSLYQEGIKNVVATCGTAISSSCVSSLRCACDTVYLVPDPDQAGLESIVKNYIAFAAKYDNINTILIDADPDEYVLSHKIKTSEELTKHSIPVDEYLLSKIDAEEIAKNPKIVDKYRDIIKNLPPKHGLILREKLNKKLDMYIGRARPEQKSANKTIAKYVKTVLSDRFDVSKKYKDIIDLVVLDDDYEAILCDYKIFGCVDPNAMTGKPRQLYDNIMVSDANCFTEQEFLHVLRTLLVASYKKIVKRSDKQGLENIIVMYVNAIKSVQNM